VHNFLENVPGRYITDPDYKKTSSRYLYDHMLGDSECSEDYDNDLFFESAEPTKNQQREQGMEAQAGNGVSSHPNANLALMSREQQSMHVLPGMENP